MKTPVKTTMANNEDFSEDLLIEVLSRLPVKSLMRYKFVCRFWYALIKSPTFISRHIINYSNDNTRLVVEYVNANVDGPPYILYHDQTLLDLSCEKFEAPNSSCLELLGSYHGLFCVHDKTRNRMFLWNLATRELRALPKCKRVITRRRIFAYHCKVGFELDSSTNDYKIAFIRNLNDSYEYSVSTLVTLYTLSTDSWTYLKAVELSDYTRLEGTSANTYLNKVCYWLAWRYDGNQVILSFHMRNEAFKEMRRPRIPKLTDSILAVYEESLHLLDFDISDGCFDIWVLKEGSWTKKLTTSPISGVCTVLEYWKDGSFFVKSKTNQLLVYDPNTQSLRDTGIKAGITVVHSYKESLISTKWADWVVDVFDISIPWHILGVYQTGI